MDCLDDFKKRLSLLKKSWDNQKIKYSEKMGILDEVQKSYMMIIDKVSVAKTRLNYKDEISSILEEFQNIAFEESINLYNQILNENSKAVIEHADSIKLVPLMSHGNQGLKILTYDKDNNELDLFKDAPGSIRNISAIILRAISVKISNLRPFLCLDEPDHWISSARTEKFFNQVGRDLCTTQGFQILVISHHPTTIFKNLDAEIISVFSKGEKHSDVLIQNETNWIDDKQQGIRYLMLKNIAQFKNCFIPLSPGLNVLMGDNGIGKSRITRALRAICYGDEDASDTIISHGQTNCEITLGLENNLKLVWSRDKKRNPKMQWSLLDENDNICNYNGERCLGSDAKNPPSWVFDVLNIKKCHDIDLQLVEQHDSLFILDKKPSERAKILNIGSVNNFPASILQTHKKQITEDKKTITDSAIELSKMSERLKILETIRNIAPDIEKIDNELDTLNNDLQLFSSIDDLYYNIYHGKILCSSYQNIDKIFCSLPSHIDIDDDVIVFDKISKLLSDFYNQKNILDKSKQVLNVLSKIPSNFDIETTKPLEDIIQSLTKANIDLKYSNKIKEILFNIPELPNSLSKITDVENVINKFLSHQKELELSQKKYDIFKKVDDIILSDIEPTISLEKIIVKIGKSQKQILEYQKIDIDINEELNVLYREIGELAVNGCPLCGSPVSHEHIKEWE